MTPGTPRVCGSLPPGAVLVFQFRGTENMHDSKEAVDHYINPVCRFSELQAGEQFRFPGSQTVQLRTKSGYRRWDGGRVFRTGARVAVIPISGEQKGFEP